MPDMPMETPHVPEESEMPQDVAAAEEPQVDPTAELAAENAELRLEIDAAKDQILRMMAEAQTVQRRMRQQFDQDKKFAAESLMRDLIPVLDNLERSLAAADNGGGVDALIDGVRAVERQLRKALSDAGLTRIPSVGSAFDPHLHEALVSHDTDEVPHETILDEIEAGYSLHDRVIRPARVRVSRHP